MQIENEVLYNIWKDRYSKNGESIDENLHRVAKYCSTNEKEEHEFYDIMNDGLFFPAGRTMSNAGVGKDLTLNNCFTSPLIKDDLTDIFEKVSLGARTHQKGGGIGYNFSQLRPKGSPTSNEAVASGAISFMDVFNAQTSTILQGNRRGANMGLMSVYSMDIEEFINAKSYDEGKLIHFNVTVLVDDDFMRAVKNDEDIYLHYPVYDENGFILKDESKWKYKKKINAKYLWNLIIQKAYDNGEPGIAFEDTMNRDNNLWYIERITTTNPCFEYLSGTVYGINPKTREKLNPNEYGGACNLGSIFWHYIIDDPFTKKAKLNMYKLEKAVNTAVRFLDNIIDINKFPDKIYENYQKAFRTIGLGVTGVADALCMLNIKYGSKESIKYIGNLMNTIAKLAYRASIELAKEKGEFPFLDREKFIQSGFIQKHIVYDKEWEDIASDILKYGIRNSKILSVAPTGTLSLTFGNNCSSGLEPIFSLSYDRKVKIGGQSEENTKIVKMEDYAYKLWNEFKNNPECIVKEDVFVTAMNLSVQDHLEVLRTIAFHVDMSCSKTINIPTEYPFEETKKVYEYCWENGIKGCTIFRPNPIRQGILIAENTEKKEEEKEAKKTFEIPRGYIINCSDDLIGRKRKIINGCGTMHLQAWADPTNGDILEVYLSKGSQGGCLSFTNGLSRMISLALRGGVHIEDVCEQLDSVTACPSYAVRKATKNDTAKGNSCPMAIGKMLMEIQKELWAEFNDEVIEEEAPKVIEKVEKKDDFLNDSEKEYLKKNGEIAFVNRFKKCPRCGEHLSYSEGCLQCSGCGFTKCG